MLAAFVRFLIWLLPWLSADYRRRIKPTCKCPACGDNSRKAMKFDAVEKLVVLTCQVCSAQWGYNPIVTATKWAKPETDGE